MRTQATMGGGATPRQVVQGYIRKQTVVSTKNKPGSSVPLFSFHLPFIYLVSSLSYKSTKKPL